MSKKKRPTPVPPEPLIPLFDAHTHLSSVVPKDTWDRSEDEAAALYEQRVVDIMERAQGSGLVGVCTVGDGLAETERALQAAHFHDKVWAACAVHPTLAHEVDDAAKARLTEMAHDPRCVAIGETGLDAYWIQHDESTPSIPVSYTHLPSPRD